jgi:hypothetical protein
MADISHLAGAICWQKICPAHWPKPLARRGRIGHSAAMDLRTSEDQLAALDVAVAAAPDRVDPRYCRASLLASLGRTEQARADYLAVIAIDPTHFGALNDLGTLLYQTDFRSAARLAYAEAVKHHPDNPIGRINLGNALLANGETDDAQAAYEAALRLAPDHPDAHQGLANLLQGQGRWEEAEHHRQLSYRARTVTVAPYRGAGDPCRVLVLMSGVGGNVPTRFVLDDRLFATSTLVVEAFSADRPLPPHDIVFNAIGDADLCGAALEAAEAILVRTGAPVVNAPSRVGRTGRAANAQALAGLPHTVAPKVIQTNRAGAPAAASSLGYPLLVRSPGFHTGLHFQKVDGADQLAAACDALPTEELLLIEFLDARDRMGQARKYRVMMIGGRLFPLHLAISDGWKVHYFTADMAENPHHRAEEAAFLNGMADVLGPKVMTALDHICVALDLDYAGIDFGVDLDGSLLLFEANATMVINPPGPEPIWDYRRPHIDRVLAAAQGLILDRGRSEPRRA